jgi:hypothetical protein
MRDAATAGRLEADWVAELDALGMIWDKHDAAWRARLAAAADYVRTHGHLATKNTLDAARADALTALAPDWRLPHGADWHRKYHLLRTHLATGADPATLTRDTQIGGVKIGSWLARQLTSWHALADGQQQLMTALGLTPEVNPPAVPAAPSSRPCSCWNSSCTARAAPPQPARASASTATPSRSAPGWPRPAPSTAPASSPKNTPAWSLRCSTGTGRPRTPSPPSWCRPCCGR